MKTVTLSSCCKWAEPDNYCFNAVEGRTEYCAHHNRLIRKQAENERKQKEKRKILLSKKREPRSKISKNSKDWKNTFICSSGKKVTQAEINRNRDSAYNYQAQSTTVTKCHGCGQPATCRAHVIPQARCKQLNKTELIWHLGNFFPSCFKCNSAIENPKGIAWNGLKNIGECLTFIEQHDPELFAKFSLSGTFEL